MGKQRTQSRQQSPDRVASVEASRGATDSDSAPLFTAGLARDASVVVLAAISVLAWLGAHTLEEAMGVAGAVFVASSFALGLIHPTAGLLLAIATVPFQGTPIGGLPDSYGIREFARAAPIWGSLVRTLSNMIARGREPDASPRLLLFAALASGVLAPLTRVTAEAYPEYQAGVTGFVVDTAAILGTQSLMWAAWILASNLPRRVIPLIERTMAITLPIAIVVAIIGFFDSELFSGFIFDANTFGRLAGLGYPTPTAMGIAIGMPIAAAIAWRISKPLAGAMAGIALLTIFLTESRGPLLASIGSAIVAAIVYRNVPWRLVADGGAAGAVSAVALLLQRYGSRLSEWLAGGHVNFFGQSDSTRVESWIAAIQIIAKRPLDGVGWMGLRFWDPIFAKNQVYESHNIVLLAFASGGIPFGVATAIGVVGSMAMMWRNRRQLPIAWIAAAVALIICGLWDMPQARALAALYGGIALGVVARGADPAQGNVESPAHVRA